MEYGDITFTTVIWECLKTNYKEPLLRVLNLLQLFLHNIII